MRGFTRGVKVFGGLVEEIQATINLLAGIEGNDAVVRRNSVRGNGGSGIACFDCVVTENVARDNLRSAFNMGGGGVFGSNTVFANGFVELTQTVTTQHNSSCSGAPC